MHFSRLSLAAVALLVCPIVLIQQGGAIASATTNLVTVEDTSTGTALDQFQYKGTWTQCKGCQPQTLNSSYHSTSTSSSSVTLRFNGTQAYIGGIVAPNGGISRVTIDAGVAVIIDTYSPNSAATAIFTTPVLAPGSHTVMLTDTHTHNSNSTGYFLRIDLAQIAPSPNAVLYGKSGTFGSLGSNLPTGESLQTNPVNNWGFSPGESEFFTAIAPTGEIVMGTNSQTDDEKYATANQLDVGIFNPTLKTFRNLAIPTSNGSLFATNPFYPIGGATVDGLVPVTIGGIPRIAFTSADPYNGWDTTQYGEYPSLGYLDTTTGNIAYNQSMSVDASQINAKGGRKHSDPRTGVRSNMALTSRFAKSA